MSNEGFRNVPGVPEGWELVAIRSAKCFEHVLDDGKVKTWAGSVDSGLAMPILRKIEKPAKYRPFANAAEADQFWNAALRFRNPHQGHEKSRFRINTIGCDGITVGLDFYSYQAAFSTFCVDDDGTPFGVLCND